MRSVIFIAVIIFQFLFLALMNFTPVGQSPESERGTHSLQEMVRALQLTDLAVWTESRYTRHPSQSDRFSSFQDGPGALEHFPAGSLVGPPPGPSEEEW